MKSVCDGIKTPVTKRGRKHRASAVGKVTNSFASLSTPDIPAGCSNSLLSAIINSASLRLGAVGQQKNYSLVYYNSGFPSVVPFIGCVVCNTALTTVIDEWRELDNITIKRKKKKSERVSFKLLPPPPQLVPCIWEKTNNITYTGCCKQPSHFTGQLFHSVSCDTKLCAFPVYQCSEGK